MRFVSYIHRGEESWGAVVGERGVVPASTLAGGAFKTLAEVLAAGKLGEIQAEAAIARPSFDLSDITFLPTIPRPDKFFAAGLNYSSHIEETQKGAPEQPRFHLRSASSLVGHGQPIIRPRASAKLDFEGELAIIIGKRGRHIPESAAFDYVAGYTCFMDGSVRDFQEHMVTSGKNFYGTGALGPWLVSSDVFPRPPTLDLATVLNGAEMQRTRTNLLIYSIPRMINYLSTITFLEPGDVVATGTPEGVGYKRSPPIWLKPGDTIEVEIDGIGRLSNPVVDE
jgi:2-keto-4-pentenoate hydratase/2-oxohepta-3-ene-1,7-dioic acid hydratase in catechol pathway